MRLKGNCQIWYMACTSHMKIHDTSRESLWLEVIKIVVTIPIIKGVNCGHGFEYRSQQQFYFK